MGRVATILNIAMQITANLAIAFEPFLPFSSRKLRDMLNLTSWSWSNLGSLDMMPAGAVVNKPELLFEKIEDAPIEAQIKSLEDIKKQNEEVTNTS